MRYLSVHFISGDVDVSADGLGISCSFEQDVRSQHVVLCECAAVSERVIDVGLGGKVNDGVDLELLDDVIQKLKTNEIKSEIRKLTSEEERGRGGLEKEKNDDDVRDESTSRDLL